MSSPTKAFPGFELRQIITTKQARGKPVRPAFHFTKKPKKKNLMHRGKQMSNAMIEAKEISIQ